MKTKLVHRGDGYYDLTVETKKEQIKKEKITLREAVFELEMISYQEEEDGGTEK